MSENERRPELPVWRQIVGTVWRVDKKIWREAAIVGLIGGVIGAAAADTLGYQLYGWGGLLVGGAAGFIVGWLLLVLFQQSASFLG